MSRSVLTVLLLLAGSSIAASAEDVPLYTNADLVRFRTPETADDPQRTLETMAWVEPAPCLTWAFVAEFLEREHARIDAERRSDLERSRLESLQRRPVYVAVPYYPALRYPYRPRGIRPHHRPRPEPRPRLDGRDAVPGPPSNRPSHGYDLAQPQKKGRER